MTAKYDEASEWDEWSYNQYSSLEITEDFEGKSPTLTINNNGEAESGSFTVTAKTNKKKETITIIIDEDGKLIVE